MEFFITKEFVLRKKEHMMDALVPNGYERRGQLR